MFWKAVTLLGLAVCTLGEHHATSEQMVKQEFELLHGHHGELNHIGSHTPEHHEEYAWAYPSYEFSYTVHDPHTHDHKGQYEHRKGDEVRGEYWLVQPDGKKRTVKYESDKHKGFKANVHYSEHHEHHEHHVEPHVEEIVKPVVEVVEEEPPKLVEESEPIEPILVGEIPEVAVEEREEEHIEPIHLKPRHHNHKPIHIEYYINHKYRKHHHEEHSEHHKRAEPEEERQEEERNEGQEARIHEKEEHRVEVKHRKPIRIEHYSKIHHPIHNEHHGHEIPKHNAPVSIVVHHDNRKEQRGNKEKLREKHEENEHHEERIREERVREERIREERVREEQHHREEPHGRKELRGRKEHRGREEHHEREEQRGHEIKHDRKEHRGYEEHREREELHGGGKHRGREEYREREELHGGGEHRGREEYRGRDEHDHEEHHLPFVPLLRPLYSGRRYEHGREYNEVEKHRPIRIDEHRPERKHEPHDQLLRLHKPVLYRPEHGYHYRSSRPEKTH